jgi:hypothetical protein
MSPPSVSVGCTASASKTTPLRPVLSGQILHLGPKPVRVGEEWAVDSDDDDCPGWSPCSRAGRRRGRPEAGSRPSCRTDVREERAIRSSSDRTTPIRIPAMIPTHRIPIIGPDRRNRRPRSSKGCHRRRSRQRTRPPRTTCPVPSTHAFDRAMASFAETYADQNERDYGALREAVDAGRVVAETGV